MSRRVKPSKVKSLVVLFVGLILICIGLFVVIPKSLPLGIILTLFAVIITVLSGFKLISIKGATSQKIVVNNDNSQRNISTTKTPGDNLNELQSLYKKGMISVDEFKEKRKQLF